MQKTRAVKYLLTLEERLTIEAKDLRLRAEKMQPGRQRDDVIRRERRTDTASHIKDRIRSPGLRAPT